MTGKLAVPFSAFSFPNFRFSLNGPRIHERNEN
jgi:hypothetical protein